MHPWPEAEILSNHFSEFLSFFSRLTVCRFLTKHFWDTRMRHRYSSRMKWNSADQRLIETYLQLLFKCTLSYPLKRSPWFVILSCERKYEKGRQKQSSTPLKSLWVFWILCNLSQIFFPMDVFLFIVSLNDDSCCLTKHSFLINSILF